MIEGRIRPSDSCFQNQPFSTIFWLELVTEIIVLGLNQILDPKIRIEILLHMPLD
jgi:hypothetical protein